MEHTKHIWRAVLIILVGLITFIVVRDRLVPESFGKEGYGYYRADSLKEYMAYPVKHGGRDSCRACHAKEYETASDGKHKQLNCEVCHGPVSWHAKDGKKIADMPKLPSYKLCGYCHQKLASRPDLIKQVNFIDHLVDQGFERGRNIPAKICFKCHKPHSPFVE